MGTVYRKTTTKPLPPGAEIFTRKGERCARWRDSRGKFRTAKLTTGANGAERIVIEVGTYTAKYRDGSGLVVERATGCHDETAARGLLAKLQRRAELVKANVISAAEDAVADHQAVPLNEHFDAFKMHLESAGTTLKYRDETLRRLRRIAIDCGFAKLTDLDREALECWLVRICRPQNRDEKMILGASARTRNAYREAAVAFGNWCVESNRLLSNPFALIAKANQAADPRRQRRAMTESELLQLLDVARRRPLLDAMTVRRGKRKGEATAELRPDTVARLETLGRERALIYKTLVLTGLRLNELRTLTVGQLHLDGPVPFVALDAADEKSRQGNSIPLRIDLAADLRQWLDFRRQRLYGVATVANGGQRSATIPMVTTREMPTAETTLFKVPTGMVRILDRDLKLATIPKRDERGRTLDMHALRHTFGTLLSKGGVAPRTAQAAMRHSTIDLTMNVYTDPKLLDVQGAVEALPSLPLGHYQCDDRQLAVATGTDGGADSRFAPGFAPTPGLLGQTETTRVTTALPSRGTTPARLFDATSDGVKRNDPLTTGVNGSSKSGQLALV